MILGPQPVSDEKWCHIVEMYRKYIPKQYKDFNDVDISMADGPLLYDNQIVMLQMFRSDVFEKIYTKYLGIISRHNCKKRNLLWNDMKRDIKNMVNSCALCQIYCPKLTWTIVRHNRFNCILHNIRPTSSIKWFTRNLVFFTHKKTKTGWVIS